MKILGIHIDPCHLGGHTRAFLMFMDIFKSLGFDVHVVSRHLKQYEAKTEMPIRDPDSAKIIFTEVNVKTTMKLQHYSLNDIKQYQPLRCLDASDITRHDIPVVYWGKRFLSPWAPEVLAKIEDADYVFCDTEMYVRMETDLNMADKHVQFVHFPTVSTLPVKGKEPKHVWANSFFTKKWIRIRWGYNNPNYFKAGKKYATVKVPNQVFDAEIVHPPLYVDDYSNNARFKDRNFDVVMFARLGEDKFTVAGFLDEHFKLLSMGALSPLDPEMIAESTRAPPGAKTVNLSPPITKKDLYVPRGTLHRNVKMKDVPNVLQKAKMYVHSKGFGMTSTGEPSAPEHFGITVCEAMAAGCPTLVPRNGGCWTDISEYGKYTLGYSSLEELKFNIKVLTKDKKEWQKWHELALKGVQRFDAENVKTKVKDLLS